MIALHLLVTGSRNLNDERLVAGSLFAALTALAPGARPAEIDLTHGACTETDADGVEHLVGADGIADAIGYGLGWNVHRYPADWYGPCDPSFCRHGERRVRILPGGRAETRTYCQAAGPRRNAAMVERFTARIAETGAPHLVLAFPLGRSVGTRGCVRLATRAGLTVREVETTATVPVVRS